MVFTCVSLLGRSFDDSRQCGTAPQGLDRTVLVPWDSVPSERQRCSIDHILIAAGTPLECSLNHLVGDLLAIVRKVFPRFNDKASDSVADRVFRILSVCHFPGNIRELENIIQHAVALTDAEQIRQQDLPDDLQQLEFDTVEGGRGSTLVETEKRHIIRVLEKTGYNKGLTAQILGVPRTTLWRKLAGYKKGDE
ncbi:MAG: helix-turn-helix domain-containing protein [Acidobacteriota bacterium]